MDPTPLASVAIQMPEPESCAASSAADLIKGFLEYETLFQDIATYPQAGIYERFAEERALTLSWIESEVHREACDVKSFMRRVKEGATPSQADNDVRTELANRMKRLTDVLLLHGMYRCQSK